MNTSNYDVEIWMAFAETFGEKMHFHTWLLQNGYAELAALSSAVKGSHEAFDWLMQHGYFHLAALDGAIDNKPEPAQWLLTHNFEAYFHLAAAVNLVADSIKWLEKHDLGIFLHIAARIRNYRENQTFDYHKKNFEYVCPT